MFNDIFKSKYCNIIIIGILIIFSCGLFLFNNSYTDIFTSNEDKKALENIEYAIKYLDNNSLKGGNEKQNIIIEKKNKQKIKKPNINDNNTEKINLENKIKLEKERIQIAKDEYEKEKLIKAKTIKKTKKNKQTDNMKNWDDMCKSTTKSSNQIKYDDLKLELELNDSSILKPFNNDDFGEYGKFNC